jgi:hypothetical protein
MNESTERPLAQMRAVRHDAEPSSLTCLEAGRIDVDRVLADMPENRLEARRAITREWALDPTPDELKCIVKIAHDPAGREGLPQELARMVLVARIAVDRVVGQLLDSEQLEVEPIRQTVRYLPELMDAVDALGQRLRADVEDLAPVEREFVQHVADVVFPSRDGLVAAAVLAPRLEQLAQATGEQDIRDSISGLTDAEVAMLAFHVCPAPGDVRASADGDPGWPSTDAVLLGAVLRDDLALLKESADAPGDAPELLPRLERDKAAYHVVAGRLQKRQNAALLAGLKDYADGLSRVQQRLFAIYRQLAAALNTGTAGNRDGAGEAGEASADLQLLLDESAAQDDLADAARANRVSDEELYRDALEGVASPQQEPKPLFDPRYNQARERVRIRVLSSIAAVLFVACVVVWTLHLDADADPLAVELTEMSDTLILDEAVSVGPMLYVVVSHWSWDSMSNEERLGSARALGLSAANNGYETVYLVDEKRQELAMWSKSDGAKLMGPQATEEPGPDS